ncbi:hypothetical protein GCM10011521_01150 [Arenimonas soli]|uniref:Uncharacterized protein n=1 Tax=Arenimonas soli TaxID=2269504 RepID=A0ABQ1HAJ9_9GAMM|nr:hypothetical protein [Arenimonas soli]GGA66810.1 hypothetical protein GCM10011521_01150 [Arenimonas soli]
MPLLAAAAIGGAIVFGGMEFLDRQEGQAASVPEAAVADLEVPPAPESMKAVARAEVQAPPGLTAAQATEEFARSELADLGVRLDMQPDAGQWSRGKEQSLDRLVLEEETFAWARAKILDSDVQCRQAACRASYRFASLLDADDFAAQLLLMMDSEFTGGRTIPVRREDGSHEVHVFVVTPDARELLSTGRAPPETISTSDVRRGGAGG